MPDLNSVPPSPHIPSSASRRTASQQMPPPPVPSSPSLNILPSNQNTVNQGAASSSSLPSPQFSPSVPVAQQPQPSNAGVGPGPGPIRHPRPLTAADLHLQLEKEQEAVVNRLTRELSLLRAAQNASVVSDTSSTSATASGAESSHVSDQHLNATSGGFSHPLTTGARRHHQRTSSNTSARSLTAAAGSVSGASITGISSPAPVRPGNPAGGIALSRQNSTASRRSRAASPAPHADPNHPSYFAYRGAPAPLTSVPSTAIPGSTAVDHQQLSPGLVPATVRYEETAFYRSELESVRRENEALKRRVRDLERMIRDRRASDASRHSQGRQRSESASTAASVSVAASVTGATAAAAGSGIAAQRDGRDRSRVASMMGVPEDEVRVGESAASAGLRRE